MGYYDKKITAKKAISWTTAIVLIGGVIGAAATIEPQTELTTIYEETVPLTEAPTLGYEYLSNLKAVEEYGLIDGISSEEDSLGNQHIGNILLLGAYSFDSSNVYAIYYLGGQYKTLSGTIAVSDDSSQEAYAQLCILADDHSGSPFYIDTQSHKKYNNK